MHCGTLGLGHTWSIYRAIGNYEKQLQRPTDDTVMYLYLEDTISTQLQCTYDYVMHGVLKWQPLNQVGYNICKSDNYTTMHLD